MLAMITTDISCYLIFQLAPVQQFNVILAAHFFMLSPFQSNLIKNWYRKLILHNKIVGFKTVK